MELLLIRRAVVIGGLVYISLGFSFAVKAADESMKPLQNWPVSVRDASELRDALTRARGVGGRIELASGDYGNFAFEDIRGTAWHPVVLAASDWQKPPRFVSLHLSRCTYLEVRDIIFAGAPDNGLNIDDGGDFGQPSHHITLSRLQVRDVGPQGNHDGIKISGLEDFRIEECRVERWGLGGQGIDMVGCHRGLIENNWISHREDVGDTDTFGVQPKGGSRDITIRGNRFINAGTRAINAGGSTGLTFFRPSLDQWPRNEGFYEAKNIVIEGNTFIGSDAPIAFVGVDGAVVRFNTIYRPRRWAMRVLQETTAPNFVPCRNVMWSDNIIVFDSKTWLENGVNIGPKTAPETFQFARNWWFDRENPAQSRPNWWDLPPDTTGRFGENPMLVAPDTGDFRLAPASPVKANGRDRAGAYAQG